MIGKRRADAQRALLRAALDAAEGRKRAGVIIPYMPLAQAIEMAAADERARVLLHSAEATLDVPDGGLASLLASIGTRRRWKVQNELTRFSEMGNVMRWSPVTPELEDVAAELIARNRAKYGSHQGADWMRSIFAGQRRTGILNKAVAALALRDQQIVSIAVSYRFGDHLHLRYFGADYSVDHNDFRYFVLCYYAPLDYAAAHGIRTYHESIASLEAKSARGAKVEPLAAVVATTDGIAVTRDVAARHNQLFAQAFREQFSSRLGSDWSICSE
ncbi:hypothetical protein VL15_03750 [Burkholderia cepacia]|uniref:Uncharacterized protein n=1 Tax=Burkholderia cepacia TaxID=292 RepID=A0A0J5XCD3_BURCE|nr:hypothetical protein VL15_03750 [Burkholderia cepacia]